MRYGHLQLILFNHSRNTIFSPRILLAAFACLLGTQIHLSFQGPIELQKRGDPSTSKPRPVSAVLEDTSQADPLINVVPVDSDWSQPADAVYDIPIITQEGYIAGYQGPIAPPVRQLFYHACIFIQRNAVLVPDDRGAYWMIPHWASLVEYDTTGDLRQYAALVAPMVESLLRDHFPLDPSVRGHQQAPKVDEAAQPTQDLPPGESEQLSSQALESEGNQLSANPAESLTTGEEVGEVAADDLTTLEDVL